MNIKTNIFKIAILIFTLLFYNLHTVKASNEEFDEIINLISEIKTNTRLFIDENNKFDNYSEDDLCLNYLNYKYNNKNINNSLISYYNFIDNNVVNFTNNKYIIVKSETINFNILLATIYFSKEDINIYEVYEDLIDNGYMKNNISIEDVIGLIDGNNISKENGSLEDIIKNYYLSKNNNKIKMFFTNNFNINDNNKNDISKIINSDDFNKYHNLNDFFINICEDSFNKIELNDIDIINIPSKIKLEEPYELNIKFIPNNATTIDYDLTTSNNKIIEIKDNILYPKNIGSCKIKISCNNISKEYSISVVRNISNIILDKEFIDMDINDIKKIKYSFDINSKEDVIFETSNNMVATINNNGEIKAINAGKCYITIKLKDNENIYSKCNINVFDKIEKINILNNNNKLFKDDKINLNIKIIPSDNLRPNEYKFESSNNDIIKIENNENLIGMNYGKATIYCKNSKTNEIYDEKEFFVYEKINNISFNYNNFNIYLNNNTIGKIYNINYYLNNDIYISKLNYDNDIFYKYDFKDIKFEIYQNNKKISPDLMVYSYNQLILKNNQLEGDFELKTYINDENISNIPFHIINNVKKDFNNKNINHMINKNILKYNSNFYIIMFKILIILCIILFINIIIYLMTKQKK